MSEQATIILALISALATVAVAYFKMRSEIRGVHQLVNSRMTELLDLTRIAATAEGTLAGEKVGQDRLNVPGAVEESEDTAHRATEERAR